MTTAAPTPPTPQPVVPAGSTVLTEDSIAQSLAQDRPTIDAAVKTFMIWVVARSITSSATDDDKIDDITSTTNQLEPEQLLKATNVEAEAYARILLRAINRFAFNESLKSVSKVAAITAQVWNGLVASQQKPARFLGRIALRHAWDGILLDIEATLQEEKEESKASLFISEFGTLLKEYTPTSSKRSDAEILKDGNSNAALIWDEPGAELERRRQRRQLRAEEAIKAEKQIAKELATPRIEEILEEDEEEEAE